MWKALSTIEKVKSFMPIMMPCHPREGGHIWTKEFADLAQEQHRRRFPAVSKFHCDWRKDIPLAGFQSLLCRGEDCPRIGRHAWYVDCVATVPSRAKRNKSLRVYYTIAYLSMHVFFSTAMNTYLSKSGMFGSPLILSIASNRHTDT